MGYARTCPLTHTHTHIVSHAHTRTHTQAMYARRAAAAASAAREHLKGLATFREPTSGMFMWFKLEGELKLYKYSAYQWVQLALYFLSAVTICRGYCA